MYLPPRGNAQLPLPRFQLYIKQPARHRQKEPHQAVGPPKGRCRLLPATGSTAPLVAHRRAPSQSPGCETHLRVSNLRGQNRGMGVSEIPDYTSFSFQTHPRASSCFTAQHAARLWLSTGPFGKAEKSDFNNSLPY